MRSMISAIRRRVRVRQDVFGCFRQGRRNHSDLHPFRQRDIAPKRDHAVVNPTTNNHTSILAKQPQENKGVQGRSVFHGGGDSGRRLPENSRKIGDGSRLLQFFLLGFDLVARVAMLAVAEIELDGHLAELELVAEHAATGSAGTAEKWPADRCRTGRSSAAAWPPGWRNRSSAGGSGTWAAGFAPAPPAPACSTARWPRDGSDWRKSICAWFNIALTFLPDWPVMKAIGTYHMRAEVVAEIGHPFFRGHACRRSSPTCSPRTCRACTAGRCSRTVACRPC